MKNILILGFGNPLLCDDAIGPWLITKCLADPQFQARPELAFRHLPAFTPDLLYEFEGMSHCLIIDSLAAPAKQGGVYELFRPDQLISGQYQHVNSHGMDLASVLKLGQQWGFVLPSEIVILGIYGRCFHGFCMVPSVQIINRLPEYINVIKTIISNWVKAPLV